jgi:hypothetical protein
VLKRLGELEGLIRAQHETPQQVGNGAGAGPLPNPLPEGEGIKAAETSAEGEGARRVAEEVDTPTS